LRKKGEEGRKSRRRTCLKSEEGGFWVYEIIEFYLTGLISLI